VREAFRLAQQERPGPVHLELPEDIAGEEVPEVPLRGSDFVRRLRMGPISCGAYGFPFFNT